MYYVKLFMKSVLSRINPIAYPDLIKMREGNYSSKILYSQEGNDLIGSFIKKNEPLMVARIGGTELQCISFFLQERLKRGKRFPHRIKRMMSIFSGFFPLYDDMFDRFAELFLSCVKDVDVMAVWFNDYEDVICNEYCKEASLIELDCLIPFIYKKPWTSKLEGKKVLVVHPFVESIKKQYFENRQLLFEDQTVLPEFDLKLVRAVQSIAGAKVDFNSWFDAYDFMCQEIAKVDFDIALIGAGAYGLPLASFVKRLGKQAIHLGGITQLLFGIRGKRWEAGMQFEVIGRLFNDNWIRPAESETPENYRSVEYGCYW